jgi:hypothetical protein
LNWRRQRALQPTLRPGRLLHSACLQRSSRAFTDRIIARGRALVRAIEVLGSIQRTGLPALLFTLVPDLPYTMCA